MIGVCGLMRNSKGEKLGSGIECESLMSDSVEIRDKNKVDGDLMEVFRTELIGTVTAKKIWRMI